MMPGAIGIDLDNTIISYDRLFYDLAVERGYVSPRTPVAKHAVGDAVKGSAGDEVWQQLQAIAYGPRIEEAVVYEGVCEFLKACVDRSYDVYIISHKTAHARADRKKRHNLHQSALAFLESQSITGTIIPEENVFFLPSRGDKISQLMRLGCAHMIDDLKAVFDHPRFPATVSPYLFDPFGTAKDSAYSYKHWRQLYEKFFQD